MKYILVRHGETKENKEGIFQGQNDGTLTRKGLEQTERVASRLKKEKIDAIFSSDLGRTAYMARTIGKYHPEIPIYFNKKLRERDLGSFVGKKKSLVDWMNPPPDIETKEEMRYRLSQIFRKICEADFGQNILFVGHSGTNKLLITLILDKPLSYLAKIESQPNASITIISDDGEGNNEIQTLNDISYLNEGEKDIYFSP
ncbi:hypothetical protein GF362_02260 [Candidatus Dojkabacteria bacterium]|nr:hypothetical protein [Candidatus Dojkabacteria bacterium]